MAKYHVDYVGQTAWIRDRDGANIAMVCNPAHASLFASAPQLLDLLECLLGYVESRIDAGDLKAPREHAKEARALITAMRQP